MRYFSNMHVILELIIFCLDPLRICRRLFFAPLSKLTKKIYDNIKPRAGEKLNSLQEVALQAGLIAFTVVLIIWTAIFMYVIVYYLYMPPISHSRPVHLKFKTLDSGEQYSFPKGHVSLTRKQQLLMIGQAYRIHIDIDMPESQQNLDLGMFMVCVDLRDTKCITRGHSCRSAMMRYRSALIRTMSTWAWSPLYILGLKDEYQKVAIEIFPEFLDQPNNPITDVYVEIESKQIQFYKVTLHIVADFTGLRYIMYNWPILSAIIAISTNLFFLLMVFLLSWYHCSDSRWLRNLQYRYSLVNTLVQENMPKTAVFPSKITEHLQDADDEDASTSFTEEKSYSSDIDILDAGERIDELSLPMRSLSRDSF